MREQYIIEMINQFNRIHNQFSAVKRTYASEYEGDLLYSSEMQVLVLLQVNPGISISEIGRILCITRSAASQMVKKLNAKSFITKTRNITNERNVLLKLTEKGEKAVQEFITKESTIFGHFILDMSQKDEKEIKAIQMFLNKLEKMFDEKLN